MPRCAPSSTRACASWPSCHERRRSGPLPRLAANAALFDWTRHVAHAGTLERLSDALELRQGERLLDVGCGTGFAAQLSRTSYVGVDYSPDGLRHARRRQREAACEFAAMSADALGFRAGAFDKAMCLHVVHHFDTALLDAALRELTRVVRGMVVVVDAAPDIANGLERFLLSHDRGQFVRSRDDLRDILWRRYVIEREDVFHNTFHTVPQVLFRLLPRTGGKPG